MTKNNNILNKNHLIVDRTELDEAQKNSEQKLSSSDQVVVIINRAQEIDH